MNFRATSEDLDPTIPLDIYASAGIIAHVFHTGATVHLTDPAHQPLFENDAYLREKKPQAILCLPLALNQMVAALYVERVAGTGGFSHGQLELMGLLARQAAAAIDAAESYELELDLVHNRLDPQFLHNSYSVIAQLVVADAPRAEAMLLVLSRLHRYVFATPVERLVTLRDEIAICRDYVLLEQCRLGDRLQVEIQVEGSIDQARIPALILQPLIENSVRNGSGQLGNSRVLVVATVHDHGIHLKVADDSTRADDRRPGLSNLIRRLARLYPRRHSFQINHGSGVIVEITLPASRDFVADLPPSSNSTHHRRD